MIACFGIVVLLFNMLVFLITISGTINPQNPYKVINYDSNGICVTGYIAYLNKKRWYTTDNIVLIAIIINFILFALVGIKIWFLYAFIACISSILANKYSNYRMKYSDLAVLKINDINKDSASLDKAFYMQLPSRRSYAVISVMAIMLIVSNILILWQNI